MNCDICLNILLVLAYHNSTYAKALIPGCPCWNWCRQRTEASIPTSIVLLPTFCQKPHLKTFWRKNGNRCLPLMTGCRSSPLWQNLWIDYYNAVAFCIKAETVVRCPLLPPFVGNGGARGACLELVEGADQFGMWLSPIPPCLFFPMMGSHVVRYQYTHIK